MGQKKLPNALFGGKKINTIGDCFYLLFDDPVQATRCAIEIQRRLSAQPIQTPLGPLQLRIGIHYGCPHRFEGDFQGTDVDMAARVEATASPQQILVSAVVYELVKNMTDVTFHCMGEFSLKGVERTVLWEVDWDGKGPLPTAAIASTHSASAEEPGQDPELTRLWDERHPDELNGIVSLRECAWTWAWPRGEKVQKVQLVYAQTAKLYDEMMPDSCLAALESWCKRNENHARDLSREPWGSQVRLERVEFDHSGKYKIYLSPTKYFYYVAIQRRLGETELRSLRHETFGNALKGIYEQERLMLPSTFAIHMAVVSADGKALLRQRMGTLLYPGAWEAGVGEFMHGPNVPHPDRLAHFTRTGQPALGLFLKHAVFEELDYDGARPDDFRLYGFAVEYRTLAPKLIVVYWSDAEINRLLNGAQKATDKVQQAEAIELTPEGVAGAIKNPHYPRWGPTSNLALMLALFGKDPPMEGRKTFISEVQQLVTSMRISE